MFTPTTANPASSRDCIVCPVKTNEPLTTPSRIAVVTPFCSSFSNAGDAVGSSARVGISAMRRDAPITSPKAIARPIRAIKASTTEVHLVHRLTFRRKARALVRRRTGTTTMCKTQIGSLSAHGGKFRLAASLKRLTCQIRRTAPNLRRWLPLAVIARDPFVGRQQIRLGAPARRGHHRTRYSSSTA